MKGIKRVLYISHGSSLFGAERVFFEGTKSLKTLDYNVYTLFPNEGPLVTMCTRFTDNISVVNLPWWIDKGKKLDFIEKLKLLTKIAISTVRIAKNIIRIKPDLVITNTIAIPSGAIASFFLRKKHIWYIHEFGREDHNFNFIYGTWFSSKLMSFLSNVVIVNSLAVNRKYQRYIHSSKLKVLYYAVELESSILPDYYVQGFSKKRPLKTIIFGRVSHSKGQMEAVKAIELLVFKYNYFITLTIIGAVNDNYSNELRNYITANKLENYVTVLDFSSNPLSFVSESDICLNCSVNEAFGRITIESMKLGKLIIASNTGGNIELISNNINGILYEQGRYESLSDKIKYFYLNPAEIEKIGKNSITWANDNFNITKFQNGLQNIIRELEL